MRESRPRSRLPLAVVALTLLTACHFAPKHTLPPLPTPVAYDPALDSARAGGVRAIDIGWRDFFRDPRLDTLIAASLKNNRDLRIAVARIDQARGFYRIQGSDRLPTGVASAGFLRTGTGEPGVAAVDRATVNLQVTSFELDFWGRVRDLTEAAKSDYLATVQAQRAFRLSLIQDVAATYLASIEAAEQIRLADTTVKSRREGVRIVQVRQRAGLTSALDVRQAESLLAQAEAAVAATQLARVQINNQLAVLVGGPVAGPLPEPLPLAEQTSPAILSAGVPSELMLWRPDVLAAEERLRSAEANIGAARAAFFPSISLTGAFGFASAALSSLFGAEGMLWSWGGQAQTPFFNRGRLKGNSQIAHAEADIAIADYDRTIQVAFREVTDALAARRFLAEQVAAQERATIAQRQIAQLARTRYIEGVASFLEVLDAERSLFATEQQLLRLRRNYVENLVVLYVALGGGQLEGR